MIQLWLIIIYLPNNNQIYPNPSRQNRSKKKVILITFIIIQLFYKVMYHKSEKEKCKEFVHFDVSYTTDPPFLTLI